MANIRGNLYNITDLAMFMGLPQSLKSSNNRIVLINSEKTTQAAILIDGLVGLRSVEAMRCQASAENNEAFFSKNAYVDIDENEWLELDVDALVQDKAFIQPTIT